LDASGVGTDGVIGECDCRMVVGVVVVRESIWTGVRFGAGVGVVARRVGRGTERRVPVLLDGDLRWAKAIAGEGGGVCRTRSPTGVVVGECARSEVALGRAWAG
jgi:hypothetical protein